ncbi:hypothetical protein [Solidesulfovibrio magneticus]|uniref:hypothetical protein n=1 Tax=Solidesulfovibrio magneticus TaxID=184917 RepID=UPI0009D77434|nr:hypothetical protein [Solidesulfovibrio magneticus]
MAIVRNLEPISLEKDTNHTEVNATFTVVSNAKEKFLQIDTYGSPNRQIHGKKSQSIRFSTAAISQLKEIIATHFD